MDDMYSDGPEESAEPKGQPEDDGKHEDTGEMTAVLPKSILAGKEFKPGEEVMLQIVSMHDDEVVVKYSTKGSEDEKSGEGEEPMGEMKAPADHQMAGNSMYE
jgi:hypothetical protein